MTNKELNAAIKAELKAAGYNVRDFRVSVKDCGYSTSTHVYIKSPTVNRLDVEKVLKRFDQFECDARTGEILAGGNLYLFVEYEYSLFDVPSQAWQSTAAGLYRETGELVRAFDGLWYLPQEKELRQQNATGSATRRIGGVADLAIYLYKFATFGTIVA